jgi:adenylate kinase family enzyme
MNVIKGKLSKPQKVVVYGPEGVGKSTFASKFPEALFIDTEDSTVNMDVARFQKPSSWTMLLQQIAYVKANPKICKTLVIDTADWAERLCSEHICSKANVKGIEDFGYGKGYVYLEEEFGRFLNQLQDIIELGINVVVTAHAEIKKIEQPEEIGGYDHWQMKLEKKTMPLLKEWADILLLANYKVYVVNVDNQGASKGKNKAQGGARVMHTTHSPWWDAKNRHDLPDELPFNYNEMAHIFGNKQAPPVYTNQTVKIEQSIAQINENDRFEKDTYFYHPESDAYFMCKKGEEVPTDPDFQLSNEITKAQYEKGIAIQQNNNKPTPEAPKNNLKGIPKSLADLMKQNGVSVNEIQAVVAQRGYYPKNTPVENYDPNFINGVLVGAWPQVFIMIQEYRAANDIFTPVDDEDIPF